MLVNFICANINSLLQKTTGRPEVQIFNNFHNSAGMILS